MLNSSHNNLHKASWNFLSVDSSENYNYKLWENSYKSLINFTSKLDLVYLKIIDPVNFYSSSSFSFFVIFIAFY